MAFRTLIAASKAILLEKKGQFVEGFLVEAKTRVGEFKSTIYTFNTTKGPVTVWGNKRIDSVLLDGRQLHKAVKGFLVRVACTDVRSVKKGRVTKIYRDHKVEVDSDKKL